MKNLMNSDVKFIWRNGTLELVTPESSVASVIFPGNIQQ